MPSGSDRKRPRSLRGGHVPLLLGSAVVPVPRGPGTGVLTGPAATGPARRPGRFRGGGRDCGGLIGAPQHPTDVQRALEHDGPTQSGRLPLTTLGLVPEGRTHLPPSAAATGARVPWGARRGGLCPAPAVWRVGLEQEGRTP